MPKEAKTSQRKGNTSPKVLDPERELNENLARTERKRKQTRISLRAARSLSVQDVRNMAADRLYRHIPEIAEQLAEIARGERKPQPGQMMAINAVFDRILPRLQGIAVQGQVQHKVEFKWKD